MSIHSFHSHFSFSEKLKDRAKAHVSHSKQLEGDPQVLLLLEEAMWEAFCEGYKKGAEQWQSTPRS